MTNEAAAADGACCNPDPQAQTQGQRIQSAQNLELDGRSAATCPKPAADNTSSSTDVKPVAVETAKGTDTAAAQESAGISDSAASGDETQFASSATTTATATASATASAPAPAPADGAGGGGSGASAMAGAGDCSGGGGSMSEKSPGRQASGQEEHGNNIKATETELILPADQGRPHSPPYLVPATGLLSHKDPEKRLSDDLGKTDIQKPPVSDLLPAVGSKVKDGDRSSPHFASLAGRKKHRGGSAGEGAWATPSAKEVSPSKAPRRVDWAPAKGIDRDVGEVGTAAAAAAAAAAWLRSAPKRGSLGSGELLCCS